VPRDDGGYYDDADTGSSDGEEAEVAAAEARKGKTLAAAFQQIMQKTRTGKDATAGILVGRKQLAEKELAEEEEAEVRRTKKMRTDMKKRGHVKVPRRGKDPEHDAQEKALTKLATKGVVRLFNAVAKAQQAQRDSALLGKQKVGGCRRQSDIPHPWVGLVREGWHSGGPWQHRQLTMSLSAEPGRRCRAGRTFSSSLRATAAPTP